MQARTKPPPNNLLNELRDTSMAGLVPAIVIWGADSAIGGAED